MSDELLALLDRKIQGAIDMQTGEPEETSFIDLGLDDACLIRAQLAAEREKSELFRKALLAVNEASDADFSEFELAKEAIALARLASPPKV